MGFSQCDRLETQQRRGSVSCNDSRVTIWPWVGNCLFLIIHSRDTGKAFCAESITRRRTKHATNRCAQIEALSERARVAMDNPHFQSGNPGIAIVKCRIIV